MPKKFRNVPVGLTRAAPASRRREANDLRCAGIFKAVRMSRSYSSRKRRKHENVSS
jgi:hypothetical protein